MSTKFEQNQIFFAKARKLNFAPLLDIASKKAHRL